MTKQQFKQTLEALRKQYVGADLTGTAFKSLLNESSLEMIENLHHWSSNQLITLLQEQMNDTEIAIDGYTWIEWWISENKFGLNGLEAGINGVDVKDEDDLYDALRGSVDLKEQFQSETMKSPYVYNSNGQIQANFSFSDRYVHWLEDKLK